MNKTNISEPKKPPLPISLEKNTKTNAQNPQKVDANNTTELISSCDLKLKRMKKEIECFINICGVNHRRILNYFYLNHEHSYAYRYGASRKNSRY